MCMRQHKKKLFILAQVLDDTLNMFKCSTGNNFNCELNNLKIPFLFVQQIRNNLHSKKNINK